MNIWFFNEWSKNRQVFRSKFIVVLCISFHRCTSRWTFFLGCLYLLSIRYFHILIGAENFDCSVFGFQGTNLKQLPVSVEMKGFEPLTPCLQGRCSPNWAIPPLIRRPPILPCRLQHSTFGRSGLNRRVRDENGCYPWSHHHRKSWVP